MKLVMAIINENQLDRVRETLSQVEIARLTVTRVSGHGRQREEIYRTSKFAPSLFPKIKLEIAVNDNFVDTTCDAIIKAVKSFQQEDGDEKKGEGKIFVLPIEQCIRIRTEERGTEAI